MTTFFPISNNLKIIGNIVTPGKITLSDSSRMVSVAPSAPMTQDTLYYLPDNEGIPNQILGKGIGDEMVWLSPYTISSEVEPPIGESFVNDPDTFILKTLIAGTAISITDDGNEITITNTDPATGTTLTSVGATEPLTTTPDDPPNYLVKGLTPGYAMSIVDNSTTLRIDNTLPASDLTLTSAGGEYSFVDIGTAPDLLLKTIRQSSSTLTATDNGDSIHFGLKMRCASAVQIVQSDEDAIIQSGSWVNVPMNAMETNVGSDGYVSFALNTTDRAEGIDVTVTESPATFKLDSWVTCSNPRTLACRLVIGDEAQFVGPETTTLAYDTATYTWKPIVIEAQSYDYPIPGVPAVQQFFITFGVDFMAESYFMTQGYQNSLSTIVTLPIGTTRVRLQKRVMTSGPTWPVGKYYYQNYIPIPLPPVYTYDVNWFQSTRTTPGGYNMIDNSSNDSIVVSYLSITQIS